MNEILIEIFSQKTGEIKKKELKRERGKRRKWGEEGLKGGREEEGREGRGERKDIEKTPETHYSNKSVSFVNSLALC